MYTRRSNNCTLPSLQRTVHLWLQSFDRREPSTACSGRSSNKQPSISRFRQRSPASSCRLAPARTPRPGQDPEKLSGCGNLDPGSGDLQEDLQLVRRPLQGRVQQQVRESEPGHRRRGRQRGQLLKSFSVFLIFF